MQKTNWILIHNTYLIHQVEFYLRYIIGIYNF